MVAYKAESKKELAEDAGVNSLKMREWIKKDYDTLKQLGLKKQSKVLEPAIVKFLCEKYQFVSRYATIL